MLLVSGLSGMYLLTKETPFPEYQSRGIMRRVCRFSGRLLVEEGVCSSARAFVRALLARAPEHCPAAPPELIVDWVVGHDTGLRHTALTQADHVEMA